MELNKASPMSQTSISPIVSTCRSSFLIRVRFVGTFVLFIVVMPVPVLVFALVAKASVIVFFVVAVAIIFTIVVATATTIIAATIVAMIVAVRAVAAGWVVVGFAMVAGTSDSPAAIAFIPYSHF